ncbi:MAG: NTPase [Anaerolineae bacterium]
MGQTILLTGPPRVGKTTIIQRVVERLPGRVGGFYTAEIRERGRRQGFKIVTLDGQEGILAHVDIKGPHRVSKYGVDVAGFEAVGVAALQRAIAGADYIVIDEIGKMELFSATFKAAVREAIESQATVLGTIMLRSHPWADDIKRHPHVTLLHVTPANRDTLAEEILARLRQT